MLATLALSLTLQAPKPNPAADLVSKMLAYYAGAQSMTGTILLTASDGKGQVQVQTTLQFEKPSKLYIKQVKTGNNPMQWLAVSDGKTFSYDSPSSAAINEKRLHEPVYQKIPTETDRNGLYVQRNYTVGEIYSVVAESSLGDRSIPLDVAIGNRNNLAHDRMTWVTVESGGKTTIDGVEANVVKGLWREYGNQAIPTKRGADLSNAPSFEMVITDQGKLLRYVISYTMSNKDGTMMAKLTETWDVDLTVNGKPDENLFVDRG